MNADLEVPIFKSPESSSGGLFARRPFRSNGTIFSDGEFCLPSGLSIRCFSKARRMLISERPLYIL
jgi:hypothetical protein